MNVVYCELSSSFPKVTQHGMQYYLSIKLTWPQFSVRPFLYGCSKWPSLLRAENTGGFFTLHTRNMCSVQWNVTIPRTFHRALSAMKQLRSSECDRTCAVFSGPGPDGDDEACQIALSVLFRDLEPNRQKRYSGTLRTICVCLFFPVLLWLPVTNTLRIQRRAKTVH